MPFSVLPAIDVSEGRLGAPDGRRAARRPRRSAGTPSAAATAFVAAGARWLHVVDMDLAFRGTLDERRGHPRDRGDARQRASRRAAGCGRAEQVEALSGAGRRRVVVASAALADEDAVTEIIERITTRARRCWGSRSWTAGSALRGAVGRPGARCRRSDGSARRGPAPARHGGRPRRDRRGVRTRRSCAASRAPGCRSLAAGGIRSVADLAAVRAAGADGAVVGRSALEGSLDLAEALGWAAV